MGLGDVFLEVLEPTLEGSDVVNPSARSDAYLELLDGLNVESSEVELTEFLVFSDGRGPKGDPGSGTTGGIFSHHQTAAAAQWTLNHNLGRYSEPVILLDSAPTQPVWTDVIFSDANTVILTFPTPVTGWAYINS